MLKFFTRPPKCFNSITEKGLSSLCNSNSFRSCNLKNVRPNLTCLLPRKFHLTANIRTKVFEDVENKYAFTVLPQLEAIDLKWNSSNDVQNMKQFEDILNRDWRGSNASTIVDAFCRIKPFCIRYNINLSDNRFDKLVDGLMDHCEKLTDEELLRLLHLLTELPPCDSTTSHNFHDVWSCLDDICCWKMGTWDVNTKYIFANAWFKLNLGRLTDYIFEVLDIIPRKARNLSTTLLLYSFFHTNVCRRRTVPFELEHALSEKINEFNVDELAVIAMGYFKTRSKIKVKSILLRMVQKVEENCDTIHEISLTAILKAIRLTQNLESIAEITSMLDKLKHQIPRLSNLSCMHLALVGVGLQIKHEPTLKLCTERIVKDLETSRIKEIERMLLVNTMFNQSTKLYELAFKELHKEERRKEMIEYHRCVPCALNYLSLRKMYSYELLDQVLNEEYINEFYGKSAKMIPRELFSLDTCIDIECPDYQGHRLSPLKKYKAAKWLTDWTPTRDQYQKPTLSEKFFLDFVDQITTAVGDGSLVRADHILPHFSKADIILCKDKTTGQFVEPIGFENYILGDVKRPFHTDQYNWYAIMVLTPNLMTRNEHTPLGSILMKERQLKAIGYFPVFIFWNEIGHLTNPEKIALISKKIQ